MLTRLYIDNFRSFVNFEYRPARKQLILGANGSGKSSLLDALLFLRQVAAGNRPFDDFHPLVNRTRWMDHERQTFELDSELEGGPYTYRLVIEPWGDPPKPRIVEETVRFQQKPIFEFVEGEVHLYNDRFEHKVTYPFDWHRTALTTISPRKDNRNLTQFRQWLAGLYCFRINPFEMGQRAEREDLFPNVNLSNIAAWYRHLLQNYPKQNAALIESLRAAMDGFGFLQLESGGENTRFLLAEFEQSGGSAIRFGLHELSEGQRCLICLYTILHFVLARGSTVVLDEPDNFLALREIQPWLMAATDLVDHGQGQILVISHHPELINQWAPNCGVQLVRESLGPVRVEVFHGDPGSGLSAAELVARGWVNG